MNADVENHEASIHYYDGDYPSQEHSIFPENFDEITKFQGLAHDVQRYKEIASETGGPILEICCGSGRVAIPLAITGHDVTGVDISAEMLKQFDKNLTRQQRDLLKRVTLVEQDATRLALERTDFKVAFIAFNSLLCIPDFGAQLQTLISARKHLADDGVLVLDIVNPLRLKIDGDPIPKPFYTRKNPHTGNTYTRFATMDAFDENHRQRLHGWYDEVEAGGQVKRQHYSMHWRPIFRFEIELMLNQAGFQIKKLEGGHLKEPYTAQSPRMFIQAVKFNHQTEIGKRA